MNGITPLVGIVDDDESIRDSTSSLVRSAGYTSAVFESAQAFLESNCVDETDCLILDVRMPGMNGLELQHRLRDYNRPIPIIFVTAAHSDERVRATALKQGALTCLPKPFNDEALLSAIRVAVAS